MAYVIHANWIMQCIVPNLIQSRKSLQKSKGRETNRLRASDIVFLVIGVHIILSSTINFIEYFSAKEKKYVFLWFKTNVPYIYIIL